MLHALVPPPVNVCGLQLIAVTETFVFGGGSSVSVCDAPCPMAVNVTLALVMTVAAVAVNTAVVVPAAMVMDAGNVRLLLFAVIGTSRLVCGALLSLNVQVVVPGVCKMEGSQTRLGPFGFCPIFSVVVSEMLPMLADRFADSLDAFGAAAAANVADRLPDEITTEPGTVTFALFDESSTSTIPLCTVLLREAVHVLDPPGAI